ncbi:MAG: MFS transporter [Rickettsiaceae bacterium]|nr:MFS transporter [Rickettsiaceae bacterium]
MKISHFLLVCSNVMVQFFNYAAFGLASIELSRTLCPGKTPTEKLLNYFAAIVLSAAIRPIASIIFGSIGDYAGRRVAIILTGVVSSFGALSVFFIPSYETIGIYATISLILSRMCFKSGLTGEIAGIRLYVSEMLPRKNQNLGNGFVTVFTQTGAFVAAILLAYLKNDSPSGIEQTLMADHWRLCFLVGGLSGLILSVFRLFISETIEFRERQMQKEKIFDLSLLQIILGQRKILFCSTLMFGSLGLTYQFYMLFLPPYIETLTNKSMLYLVPFYISSFSMGCICWGLVADKYNNINIVQVLRVIAVTNILVVFYLMHYEKYEYLKWIGIFACFINAGIAVPTQIYLKNKINVAIRYRVYSLGHSLGAVLMSAPAGYVCTKVGMTFGHGYVVLFPLIAILSALTATYILECDR